MSYDVLIVDDEKDICGLISDILEDEGYTCRIAHSGSEAMDKVKSKLPSLVLQDIWLGESSFDGMKVLEEIKAINYDIPVVMMSGHGTIETAVSALKKGAYDFLEKPFNSTRLLVLIEKALENSRLKSENTFLKESQVSLDDVLIGNSESLKDIRKQVEKHAPTNSRIVLTGPVGIGKSIIAKLIHDKSSRAEFKYKTLQCMGKEDEEILHSLFGVESNQSFRPGILEQAQGGTVLIKNINELSLNVQGELVKALSKNKIQRIGGRSLVEFNVRVIATSPIDITKLVERGLFREDLFYRLNVASIAVPPLNERKEDIEDLAQHFLKGFQNINGDPLTLSQAAINNLKTREWPGNSLELKNFIDLCGASLVSYEKTVIEVDDLPLNAKVSETEDIKALSFDELLALPLKTARDEFEATYLKEQMLRFNYNISKIAEYIGMERSALHRKLKSLNVQKSPEIKEAS